MTASHGDGTLFTDATVESLARALTESAPSAGATRVIAIDGRSGAGKSSLAGLVAAAADADLISLEFLYGGWHDLEGGVARMVADLLEPIAAGRTATVPQYDWHTESWGEPVEMDAGGLLVVEGVGAFAEAAGRLIGTGVWLEAAEDVRRARAEARDGGAFSTWWDPWARQEAAHFSANRTPDRADVTILTG